MKLSVALLLKPVLLLTVLLLPGAAHAQSGRGWMDGFVYLERPTQGAAGAKIELTPLPPRSGSGKLVAKANERGEYKIADIQYGDYMLRVSSPGYRTYEIELYIMPDAHTRIHVRLKKE